MAKPKHGRVNNVHHSLDHAPARPLVPRFPSPAVLSALAVIAATSPVVAGGPLPLPTQPLDFLCPFIQRDSTPVSSDPPPSSTPTSQCSVVADKYVQGSDSLWRKSNTWTLFGSTCCPNLTASTSAIQSRPSSSQTAPSTVEFDTSVLPAGWEKVSTSGTEPTIILALAIILAGSICVFMIGCVIWRRRKKRARDIERKLGHKRGVHDDSQPSGREKVARGKMRTWAKATARWKSNVRQSARWRRKRHVSSPVNRPLSSTFSDSPQPSVVAPSVPSRRSSIAPEETDPSTPEPTLCLNGNVSESPADPPRSPSPPTYGASFDPRFSRPPPSSTVPKPTSTPSPVGPYSVQRSSQPSFMDDEPLPYIPPSDGHVAIDDKSQLAHIRALANSPPMIINAASACTMQPVSAPEWYEVEDDLEDLGIDLSAVPTSSHDFGLLPPFPPPPSKADVSLPFGYLDDHPLRYGEGDDILASLPGPPSSGPSVGALPSAPPIDDLGLEPSAPSLEYGDELLEDWDEASPYVPDVLASTDLDSTPARATESSISSSAPSVSRASFPSIPEPTASDGILPRYHP